MVEQVGSVVVKEDIGVYEPVYKKVRLLLWSDGTVTWDEDSSEM